MTKSNKSKLKVQEQRFRVLGSGQDNCEPQNVEGRSYYLFKLGRAEIVMILRTAIIEYHPDPII